MGDLWRDLIYGVRMLRKRPGFTAVAVVTLALGIGVNTAIFSSIHAILMKSLPLDDVDRLVLFSDTPSEGTTDGSPFDEVWTLFSFPTYRHFASNVAAFEDVAAFRSGEARLAVLAPGEGTTEAHLASGQMVSGNFFPLLKVKAALGRTLLPQDDTESATPVAVLSYLYWQTRWAGDRGIVGRTITVNGTPLTVVGIIPESFFGLRVRRPADAWIPLHLQPRIEQRESYVEARDVYWLNLVGRLRPGSGLRAAQAQVDTALKQYLQTQGGTPPPEDWQRALERGSIRLAPGARGLSGLRTRYAEPLRLLMGVAAFVLLIACANLTNLLLSRGLERRPEISMRLAMGAGRGRLVRMLLTESLLLAGAGGFAGLLLALWGVDLLKTMVSKTAPVDVGLNVPVLAFTAATSMAAGILFGIAPALRAGRLDLASAMRSRHEGGTGGRLRSGLATGLVVAQVALSLILLVGSGLLVRSLGNLATADTGFAREGVALLDIDTRVAGLKPEELAPYQTRLLERVRSLPGIVSATLTGFGPMSGHSSTSSLVVEGFTGPPGEPPLAKVLRASPQYARTLGITLVRGRDFDDRDAIGAPKVGLVNQAFARAYFPNTDPIGRRFGFEDKPEQADTVIVGLMADAKYDNPRDPANPMIVLPLLQEKGQMAYASDVEVRIAGDPDAALPALRKAVAEVDARVPVASTKTLARQVSDSLGVEMLLARLVSAFSALALLLACVGLYGVLSQAVARRTNEVGIRMALGADRHAILAMVLREAGSLIVVGLAIGIPGAVLAAGLLAHQLYGIGPTDPLTLASSSGVLLAVALLAGWVPAWRASRVEPLQALRTE
jgi:predicted permease